MLTLDELVARLQAIKHTGQWAAVAARAGCSYFTVARIARRDLKAPGMPLGEKLSDALAELDRHASADARLEQV